ncbi:transporter, major facilitator domain protein [Actinomyces sp. Chiba101]|uniref:MFS transporter n=1 Tax=Actinomyces TaxID=1654 RepID=UPI000974EDCE|nr:MFS transporter [Actinomyces denticolens]BAW93433.1 transporter, major facilitator domain protein [Actinomyces sp. Chiba101]
MTPSTSESPRPTGPASSGTGPMDRQQKEILSVLLIAAFMSLLAVSSVNVVLHAIETSLRASTSALQWVVSGYALVFGILLVAAGRAGDLLGRGRLFVAGLAVFGAGSLLSGLAPSLLALNLARLLMGVGSGLLSPQVTGMIQQYFAGERRGRAFGMFGGMVGVSVAVGPVMSGALVGALGPEAGWRASFLVNVPVALIGVIVALRVLPASAWTSSSATAAAPSGSGAAGARRSRADFDPLGMMLLGLATLLVMLPFVESSDSPVGAWIWASLGTGLALGAGWLAWERRYAMRGRRPMVHLGLFRTRSFAVGTLLIGAYFTSVAGIWLIIAQYVQQGLGSSALAAGLVGLPSALAGAIGAPIAGRHVLRMGRSMVLIGLVLVIASLLATMLVVRLHATSGLPFWWAGLTLLLQGAGQAMVVSPNQTLALAEVPLHYAGAAGGILQTSQRIGTSVGIAALTGIAFSTAGRQGWDQGFLVGLGASTAICLTALALAVLDLRAGAGRRGGGADGGALSG